MPESQDDRITHAVIYPPIGIARVGNSQETFFGPTVTDPSPGPLLRDPRGLPDRDGSYRDGHGRLKRQAAAFFIYGCNEAGEIVRELTGADNVAISWTVQLANTKSAWYGFQLALDIPEAASAPPSTLRNAAVADRARLVIAPKPRTLTHVPGLVQHAVFDDGSFMGKAVPLGDMTVLADGVLSVAGGFGHSASFDGSRAITFANNEGWHDDTSDGPVTATVTLDGVALPVTPSWIVVAPPDYAPNQKSVRTMWDLMRDVAIQAGALPKPARPSFTDDILPVFRRLTGLQWVNAGFAGGFGWNTPLDFGSEEAALKLNDPSPAFQSMRKALANSFRNDAVDSWSPKPWPWVYGDAMSVPAAHTPLQNASLSATQLAMLQQWAAGDFDADYGTKPVYHSLAEVPLAQQGDMLTRAALEYCLADAFHPGCEMTWPVRAATMYMAPFRFAHAPAGWVEPGYGEILDSNSVTIPNGPLYGQMPGGITRWMAVPWQTDTASCRSGYDKSYDPYVPTFWPARVPNQVMTDEAYRQVMNQELPNSERLVAFANRAAWIAPLGTTSYTDQINNMIHHFDHLGVVVARPGPVDTEGAKLFPSVIEVEDRHTPIPEQGGNAAHRSAPRGLLRAGPDGAELDLSRIDKVRRYPRGL